MVKVYIDGGEIYYNIPCTRDGDTWVPEVPSELEFDVDVDDLVLTRDDLRKIVNKHLTEILHILKQEHAEELTKALGMHSDG